MFKVPCIVYYLDSMTNIPTGTRYFEDIEQAKEWVKSRVCVSFKPDPGTYPKIWSTVANPLWYKIQEVVQDDK